MTDSIIYMWSKMKVIMIIIFGTEVELNISINLP